MPKRKAYTIIEMLIVIGIITVLLTLIIPTVSSLRIRSRRLQCASNLRQLTLACITYASQSRGYLPVLNSQGSLPNQMLFTPFESFRKSPAPAGAISASSNPDSYPISKSMCFCPANTGLSDLSGWWNNRKIGYLYMAGTDNFGDAGSGDQYYDPANPANLFTLPSGKSGFLHIKLDDQAYYDILWMDINCWTPSAKSWTGNHTRIYGTPPNILSVGNNGGTNVSYIDGHVEWVFQWKMQKRATMTIGGSSTVLYW